MSCIYIYSIHMHNFIVICVECILYIIFLQIVKKYYKKETYKCYCLGNNKNNSINRKRYVSQLVTMSMQVFSPFYQYNDPIWNHVFHEKPIKNNLPEIWHPGHQPWPMLL